MSDSLFLNLLTKSCAIELAFRVKVAKAFCVFCLSFMP